MTGPELAIAFVNTRSWRGSESASEELRSPQDLAAWCRKAGLPETEWSEEAFAAAVALREAIYRLLAAAAAKTEPAPEDLALLGRALEAPPPRRRLAWTGQGYVWDVGSLEAAPLAPVAWSAADLLASPLLPRVRLCANEKCLWVFLDESKSGNRRWCSMSACGNRAKAHRHYQRRKGAVDGAPSRPK